MLEKLNMMLDADKGGSSGGAAGDGGLNRGGDGGLNRGGDGGGNPQNASGDGAGGDNEAATWDAVLEGMPEGSKALFEEHVRGLKSALNSEREQRGELAKQLREATGKLKEGSEERKSLEELSGKLEAAELRATFYEEAAKPEIGCSNPKLAYIAAQEIGAFDKRGNVNWEALKAQFPELFIKMKTGSGNAGAGTGNPQGGKTDMNAVIRKAAGG